MEKAKDALLPLSNILLVNKTTSPFSYFTFAPTSFLLVPQLARGPIANPGEMASTPTSMMVKQRP